MFTCLLEKYPKSHWTDFNNFLILYIFNFESDWRWTSQLNNLYIHEIVITQLFFADIELKRFVLLAENSPQHIILIWSCKILFKTLVGKLAGESWPCCAQRALKLKYGHDILRLQSGYDCLCRGVNQRIVREHTDKSRCTDFYLRSHQRRYFQPGRRRGITRCLKFVAAVCSANMLHLFTSENLQIETLPIVIL